ncbi:7-cyano-7-deazaguanine synthase QueC [Amycolatopsis decaplanina]|uniref:7-cyano-7-deazaguanine synthase n=1 Tax=Amycolatopsis decaplanina DSM 44594 TaxID=1284240 RepID=M2YJW3_9PSEU|nr:7-cyano-7-deazaguanine synthase QueC [Amycolatopsis decaplanina]EME55007.1 exsB protein [Amycolatopsis decaplanina DSM 44594]
MSARELVAVVLSGGMDSTTVAAHYHHDGHPLLMITVDYGQRHRKEIDSAAAVARHYSAEHVVVDLRSVGSALTGSALTDDTVAVPDGHYAEATMKATIVPNRNAILANVAVGIALSHRAAVLALGTHAGDHFIYPDCRPAFIDALSTLVEVANEGMNPPRVEAPFLRWSKSDIARHGTMLGAPMELTWSCYKGGDRHCGVCGTCYERREAFRDADVPDPTAYLDNTTEFPAPAAL